MASCTFSQLFADLVQSIDNNNACSFTKAENAKDGAPSRNGWWLVFRDMFNPINGLARGFKTPESSDRVSNFKGKVVNQIWPQFLKITKNKSDRDLSLVEKMCKEHIRRYKKEVERAELSKKAKATQQRNFGRIEASLGAAPPRNDAGPNTTLFLEPIPGSTTSQGTTGVPPTTPHQGGASTGLGGYSPTVPGAVPSPFDSMALKLISSIGGMFASAGNDTGHEPSPSRVTPVPPSKKSKVTHLRFIRQEHSTIMGVLDLQEKIKSIKHRCAMKATDKVFKFPVAEQRELKEELAAGTKCLEVTIGGELTLDYEEIKNVTIMQTLALLSEDTSHCNPITFEFRIVDANAKASASDGSSMDYATLDSE